MFGIAHSGCLAVLTLTGNDWERYSLPSDHLAWPPDYHCHHVCMSELSDGSVIVVAGCSDTVGAWRLDSLNHWSVAVAGSYTVPFLCSLTLAQDVLLATTSQHQLVIQYVLPTTFQFNHLMYALFVYRSISSTSFRRVSLSCCHGLPPSTNALPQLLAAKNVNVSILISSVKLVSVP